LAVGEAWGGGGGGSSLSDGVALGTVASRFEFLLTRRVLAFSVPPKSPVMVVGGICEPRFELALASGVAFSLPTKGVAAVTGMPLSLSPVGVDAGCTGWLFGSATRPVWPD